MHTPMHFYGAYHDNSYVQHKYEYAYICNIFVN